MIRTKICHTQQAVSNVASSQESVVSLLQGIMP